MHNRVWGLALVAIVVVAGSTALAPSTALAAGSGPTVTSVDRSGQYPVVTIDWSGYTDAPVGVLESVDGDKLGTPANMTTVTDNYGTSPGLRSYRAAACYQSCDLDSIQAGRATLVEGPWLRPDVSQSTSLPGPVVYPSWDGQSDGFGIDLDTSQNPDAPAVGVFRDGTPIAVVTPSWGSWFYLDTGASGDTVTYWVTACYADCTVASLVSGFAQQTTPGAASTTYAATPPIPTGMGASCTPVSGQGGLSAPLEVNLITVCTVHVYNRLYATVHPTGGAEFHSDNDTLIPPSTCSLQDRSCGLAIDPQPGSEGVHAISLVYDGDANHQGSSINRDWGVNPPFTPPESTITTASCTPSQPFVGQTVTCTASVTDSANAQPVSDGGTVAFTFDRPGLDPVSCVVTAGSCITTVTPQSTSIGVVTATARFTGESSYATSQSTTQFTVIERTWIVAKPALINLISPTQVFLKLSAQLTDPVDHTPIAGSIIRFTANNPQLPLCTAVTDANGVASCSSVTALAESANGYRAFFDGETYRLRSSTTGSFIRI